MIVASRKQKSIDTALAELKAEEINAFGLACHTGKTGDNQKLIDFAVSKFGKIDILATNPKNSHENLTQSDTDVQLSSH